MSDDLLKNSTKINEDDFNRHALILSGGGGRGAYHIGVMAYLEQVFWQPDIIVGTSIGAVNAAALGSGLPLTALRDRWLDLATADVQNMRVGDVYVDNVLRQGNHVFDTSPLLTTLKGKSEKWEDRPWIIPEVLNGPASPYEIYITAVERDIHELTYYHNHSNSGITADMVRASCSIPLWYDPTFLNGRAYLDGGTIANTPFRKALEAGATEIIVVLMAPWPGRPIRSWEADHALAPVEDELLQIPQQLWRTFEPSLDMLLTEIVWKDYQLLQAELKLGLHPQLKWIRFVAPDVPLPIGLMTLYDRRNHIQLFRQAEEDARETLGDLFAERPAGPRGRRD